MPTAAATTRRAAIGAIEYHLPEQVLDNAQIVELNASWTAEQIFEKTGIRQRHIAAEGETATDLAEAAARKLLDAGVCRADEIDLLMLCTQTPDYALPSSACLLQDRLGLPTTCAAFDFDLGCSGFVYGLSLAKGMLEAGLRSKALLITAETYSKWLDPADHSVRTIFGDAAAATLLELVDSPAGTEPIGPFVFGTDGRGYHRLIVHQSGARGLTDEARTLLPEGRPAECLYMDGPEIFSFTIRTVPRTVQALLDRTGLALESLDLVVFHQANRYILEHLRKRLKIPLEKFVYDLEDCGNTVSCTIPIALKNAERRGQLHAGMTVALVGFGVGYSWAAARIVWTADPPKGVSDDQG